LRGEQREYAITDRRTTPIVGRIAGKGLADELHDRGYLVIDGVDGRAHYVRLGKSEDLADFPVGGIAEVRCNVARRADANIVEISRAGVYRVEDHRRAIESREANPDGYVAAHVRRLEALRRAGVVERVAEGVWAIPTDLVQQGRAYDAERYADQTVEVRSYIPLERQVRAQGATWLDRELLNPASQPAKLGFGSDVSQALHSRQAFLIEEGLARRQAQGVTFMQNLLAILTHRELNQVASAIATETGDIYREIRDGKPVSGIYRRSLMLASGRFALLEEAGGFALVPWRPVIEPRIGQSIAAVIEGNHVSWEFGRTRGISH
jgi:hypothetical protein